VRGPQRLRRRSGDIGPCPMARVLSGRGHRGSSNVRRGVPSRRDSRHPRRASGPSRTRLGLRMTTLVGRLH
jgi:hypothetical protein